MTECYDIILRPRGGPNTPGLLREIVAEIEKLLPASCAKPRNEYVEGTGMEQIGRAHEIGARIHDKVSRLENQRQRLIQERDNAIRKDELAEKHLLGADDVGHSTESESQRISGSRQALEEAVGCIKLLRKLGVEVDMNIVNGPASDLRRDRMS